MKLSAAKVEIFTTENTEGTEERHRGKLLQANTKRSLTRKLRIEQAAMVIMFATR